MPTQAMQDAFGEGHKGAGSGQPSAGAAPAAPAGGANSLPNPGELGHHITSFFSRYPKHPKYERPERQHSQVDSEGSAVKLTPEQQAGNDLADKAGAEWDVVKALREQGSGPFLGKGVGPRVAMKSSGSAGSGGGGSRRREPAAPAVKMSPNDMSAAIKDLHTKLTTIHNTLAVSKDPVAQHFAGKAKEHLDNAAALLAHGDILKRGERQGDKIVTDVHRGVSEGYQPAIKALAKAHEQLDAPAVHAYAKGAGVPHELPTADLDALRGASSVADVKRTKGKPFDVVNLGGKNYPIDHPDVDTALERAKAEGNQDVIDKINTARRGTKPNPYKSVVREQDAASSDFGAQSIIKSGRTQQRTGKKGQRPAAFVRPVTPEGQASAVVEGEAAKGTTAVSDVKDTVAKAQAAAGALPSQRRAERKAEVARTVRKKASSTRRRTDSFKGMNYGTFGATPKPDFTPRPGDENL